MKQGDKELIERLAEYAHEAWSGWMRYVWSKSEDADDEGSITIPPEYVSRWTRQMSTRYADLPESEKESDREQARRILEIVKREDEHNERHTDAGN